MPFLAAPYGKDSLLRAFLFDQTAHLRCFRDSQTDRLVIVADDKLAPVVRVGNVSLSEQTTLYNGSVWWKAADGSAAVFRSASDGWIYNPDGLVEPFAELDLDGETWIGDGWWKLSDEPTLAAPRPTATARGIYLNASENAQPPVVEWLWRRWERSARLSGSSAIPYGVYEPKDGASGYRTVGMQQYLDRSGGSWILATDHASLSGPAGTIRYDRTESLWILGDKGEGEWWQSAAGPSRFGVMSLDPWRHDADADEDVRDPTRGSIDLAFDRFVGTAERSSLYVAEVAVWR